MYAYMHVMTYAYVQTHVCTHMCIQNICAYSHTHMLMHVVHYMYTLIV